MGKDLNKELDRIIDEARDKREVINKKLYEASKDLTIATYNHILNENVRENEMSVCLEFGCELNRSGECLIIIANDCEHRQTDMERT